MRLSCEVIRKSCAVTRESFGAFMVTISEESVMTDYSKRIFEMLVRVLVFRLTHKDLIGKDSQADQLFEKVDAAFKTISAQSTLQASGKNAVRLSAREGQSCEMSCGRISRP